MIGQFAAGLLGGSCDFLLGASDHFANLFFGGFLDADFFGVGFFFGGGLHLPDLNIQLAKAIFNLSQAAIGVLAGGASLLQSLLDGSIAVAQACQARICARPRIRWPR